MGTAAFTSRLAHPASPRVLARGPHETAGASPALATGVMAELRSSVYAYVAEIDPSEVMHANALLGKGGPPKRPNNNPTIGNLDFGRRDRSRSQSPTKGLQG